MKAMRQDAPCLAPFIPERLQLFLFRKKKGHMSAYHLALLLGAVAMNGGSRKAVPGQEIFQCIRTLLGLNED
jgi:hypothetical protein